ncbi:MAG: aspartate aminotransferase family protein [Clostridiales bacterium]|nr:aspartate aminotransferase family protein [Clostridiales bacterium]
MTLIQQQDAEYIASTYSRFPVTFVSGEGATLTDESGSKYIDMGSGIAVNSFGYGDQEWVAAVAQQAATLPHVSNLYYTTPQVKLAKELCTRTGMKKVFFGNSGAEANECAIKVARKYAADKHGENVKPVIITLENSFHGRTLATLAATGQDVFHHTFGPFPQGFRHVPAGDAAALQTALEAGDVCGLLIETVQGEGGVNCLTPEYIKAAYDLCNQNDILLMIDEVQTGNGRTGKLFSYQNFGIMPDVVTTAKGLAGGLPMGACLMGVKVQDTMTPSSHGSTFGGNPVCAAAALSVITRMTDDFLLEVTQKGEYILSQLGGAQGVLSISGSGLMLGIETTKNAGELVRALLHRGVVTLTAKNKLRLLPPLSISWVELEIACNIIKEELAK